MGAIGNWRVILAVLAIGVLGGSAYLFLRGSNGVTMPKEMYAADAITGEIFIFDVSGRSAALWPELHPDTKEATLVQVVQDESGDWRLYEFAKDSVNRLRQRYPGTEMAFDKAGALIPADINPRRRIKAGEVMRSMMQ